MSWAARRRFIILLILGAIGAAFLATVSIATLYKTPSCSDGVQNQDEAGVDCGGSCAYLCSANIQPPTVLFTKVFDTGAGRADVVALIENKNAAAAAKNVPYRVTLYDADRGFIQSFDGVFDMPPGARVPVYVPNIPSGKQKATQAFLDIAASAPRWFVMNADSRVVPVVVNAVNGGTASEPRVEATLANASPLPLENVQAVVLVYDARKNVIAASKTIMPRIPARGQATTIFTWNSAFASLPTLLEVVPIIPLP